MSLRTIKALTPKKRLFGYSDSNRRRAEKYSLPHASGLTPPKKRIPPSDIRNRSTSRIGSDSVSNKRAQDHKSKGLRVRNGNIKAERSRSPKRQKRKNDPVSLPPFGRILADSPTHEHN